jgi:hypothetical protein
MRDSYVLQMFSLDNVSTCMEKDNDIAPFYFLLWTIQEEVIRSRVMSRKQRLEKAVLSFYLLLHYFDLSSLPRSEAVTQRFNKRQIFAVTFAEDSVWPRILHNRLVLIRFILIAPGDWSFSRLETHCLENFFRFVRQNARADDRTVTALPIIASTTCVCGEMQHLQLNIGHHGRDNVDGVVIRDKQIELTDEIINQARDLCESFVGMASLGFMGTEPLLDQKYLRELVYDWAAQDPHYDNDRAYLADFTKSPSSAKIAARNRQAGSVDG